MGNLMRKRWLAGFLGLLVALLLILPATPTFAAGTISFDDKANLLTAADRSALTEQVKGLNFNVQVVTRNEFTSASTFQSYITNYSGDSKTITIGIERKLGRVQVDPGSGMGISSSESSTMASNAASQYFGSGQWRSGLSNIISESNRVSSISTSGGGSMWIGWIVFIGILVVIIFLVAAARRRSANNPVTPVYANPPQQQYMPQQPMYGPPPGYAPGYGYDPNYGRGGSGIGSALGGAAVGYIIGSALSGGHNNNYGGGFSGGSGFGNSDGNDSGGASFGGGGDSGGGADFGGGGGDFGGGGGDF